MKKRTAVRLLSLSAAVIIALSGFLMKQKRQTEKYRLELKNSYSSTLFELDSRLNSIALILQKAVYATGAEQLSSFSSKIFSEAELAKKALSSLPVLEQTLDTVNRFLSQVGNYALSLTKSYITGGGISDSQRENLKKLEATAQEISTAVASSQISFNNGDYWKTVLEGKIKGVSKTGLATSLTELEENLTDYPTLIYDGPYSDHILSKTPLMTSNAPPKTESEALSIAKEFSGDNLILENGKSEGKIPAFNFKSEYTDIAISQNGGYTVFMRKNRDIGAAALSYNQAISKAKNFLQKNGIGGMSETYYSTEDGVCLINFAYLDGQTLCYTDLIKVGIALDNGETVIYEASGYLTNHTERAFGTPEYSAEEAERCLNIALNVKSSSMVLIPTDGGGEVRCYEFVCRGEKNEEILAYINIKTLKNEQIFITLKTDGGTLVR